MRSFKKRCECKVYFDEKEYRLLREHAEGNVSAYVRKLVLRDLGTPVKPTVQALKDAIPELTTASELLPPPKRVKVCVHGTDKGFHCWKCGGLAKIESTT